MNDRRPVVVLGGPGGGAIAALSIEAISSSGGDLELAGFLNDEMEPGTEFWGSKVLGPFESWVELSEEVLFVAPLHSSVGMGLRRERVEGLGIPRERWATVIDPRAILSREVSVGWGSLIGPGAVLGHGVRIGAQTAIRHGSHVGHDVAVGIFSFLGVNAVVAGFCTIGDCVHISPSAVLRDRISVGDGAVIGLGAVVVGDVAPGSVVAGNPATSIPTGEGD